MAIFAKYEGVDGESADANHDKWIDVFRSIGDRASPVAGRLDSRVGAVA